MAGRGLLGRRDHAVLRAQALSPSADATRNISGMPTGEPPKRWRICSGSAPMPRKRSSVTPNEASPQTDEVYGRLPNILVDSA